MKCTLLSRFFLATSLLCAAGLPVFGQEGTERELPREQLRQEQRPEMERLQGQRLEEKALQARRLRFRRLKDKILYVTPSIKRGRPVDLVQIRMQAAAGATIPLWNYSTIGYDGVTYSGMMVGRSPFFHGKRVTIVPTILVPVKLTFADTGTVFDPSAPDACAPGGLASLA